MMNDVINTTNNACVYIIHLLCLSQLERAAPFIKLAAYIGSVSALFIESGQSRLEYASATKVIKLADLLL